MPRGGCVLHRDGTVAERGDVACGLLGSRERHMARRRLLRSRQAKRAEETSTLQQDVDTLRGLGRRVDGLADDVRQHAHPGWVAHGVVASTPREVGTCAGEVDAGTSRAASRVR
jgi:hypothetical protein